MDSEVAPEQPIHPNDRMIFKQYPDTVQRQTYPPLPTRGGRANAPVPEGMAEGIAANAERSNRQRQLEGE